MSYAAPENFEPNKTWNEYTAPTVICTFGNCVGSGVPSNDIGFDGNTYINEDNDTLYLKTNGAWVIVTGGSGATQVFRSTSNPSGSPGVSVAIHYRTDTGGVWFWNGSSWDQFA